MPMTAPTEYASWSAISNGIKAVADTVEQSEADRPVHVRHHPRSRRPVREHSRAARGTAGGTTARHREEPS
jgi:hypothetical protein